MGGRATASTGNLPAELTSFIGRRCQVRMSRPGSTPDAWDEAMSLEVAARLGADIARLDNLNHCWMAEAPEVAAPVFERFWSSLG
jgi:hypothetical protein